jgi:hypothetical protein
MRNIPTTNRSIGSQAIARIPKIMHRIARTGLETVMPIFFNPFSTTSVIYVHPLTHSLAWLIFKAFATHAKAMAIFKR